MELKPEAFAADCLPSLNTAAVLAGKEEVRLTELTTCLVGR